MVSAITYSEDLLRNLDNRFAANLEITSLINNSVFSDSLDIINKTSSLKPMIASLVVPGFGQYLNHSPWWKTALFPGNIVCFVCPRNISGNSRNFDSGE